MYRAPGRVNLIGEHTDYNDGFVLPAAIDFYCWAAIGSRSDRKLVIYSENYRESAEAAIESLTPPGKKHWANYALGAAWALGQAGKKVQGANIYVGSDVPLGAGLSSSAALEVSVGFALLSENGEAVNRAELARACQKAENEFVGARVGIMDQYVSCNGRASHALLLDCRSLEHKLVKLPPQVRLVICNTMVKHELSSGEYNSRRAECEEGVKILKRHHPEVRALRDLTIAQLEKQRDRLPAVVYARCHHVVAENERVVNAVEAFEKEDTDALGRLLQESHRSLRDDFEVSCMELDLMVEIAREQSGLIGARMTGGGFGGCTINLVHAEAVDEVKANVAATYASKTGLKPEIFVTPASSGAEQVNVLEKQPAK